MKCIICETSESRRLYTGLSDIYFPELQSKLDMWKCTNCGLMYIDPQPALEQLKQHYPPPPYPEFREKPPRLSGLKSLIQKLVARQSWWKFLLYPFYLKLAYLPYKTERKKALLDVGCEGGNKCSLFETLGYEVTGVEMEKNHADIAIRKGHNVIPSSFEEAQLPPQTFDIVYMGQMIEHFKDPHLALEKTRQVLRPDGELIISTPNSDSLCRRIFGKFWIGIDCPRHLFIYNHDNIVILLFQHGFTCKDIIYSSVLGNVVADSITYILKTRPHVFPRFIILFEVFSWLITTFLDIVMQLLGFRLGNSMVIRAKLSNSK